MNNPQRPILGRLGRLWRIQQVLLLLWLLMATAMIIVVVVVVVVVEGGLGRCSLLLCRTWSGITRLGKVLRHGGESFRRLILIPAPGTVEQSRIVEVFFQIAQGIARMTSLWTDVRDVAKVDASAKSAALATSKASSADLYEDKLTRCDYCSLLQKVFRRGLTRCGRCKAYI